jgi:hypothetical protein
MTDIRSLMMETEEISETSVFSSTLTRLLAGEDFSACLFSYTTVSGKALLVIRLFKCKQLVAIETQAA